MKRDTGVELSVWQDLMDRMKACKFGVIFFGMGLTMTRGKHANSEALLALTRDIRLLGIEARFQSFAGDLPM